MLKEFLAQSLLASLFSTAFAECLTVASWGNTEQVGRSGVPCVGVQAIRCLGPARRTRWGRGRWGRNRSALNTEGSAGLEGVS